MQQLLPPLGELLPSPEGSKTRTLPANYTELGFAPARDPSVEPDGGDFLDFWRILKRRKGTLVLLSAIGAVLGFLITVPQTPIYQAKTSVEVMGLNQNFLNVKETSPVTEFGGADTAVDIQTQVRILESEALVDRTTNRLAAAHPSQPEPNRVSAWQQLLNLPQLDPDPEEALPFRYERKNLRVRAIPQTRMLEITVDSAAPALASDFANTLTTEFIDQTLEARLKTTEHTGDFLTRQIDDVRARLERSEDLLQQYAIKAGLVFSGEEKRNVSDEKLSQVQKALSDAQADRVEKQSRLEIAKASPPEALSDVLNDLSLREYSTKLTDLKRQLAEKKQIYTEESSDVLRIRAQIAPVEAAFNQHRNDILKRIANEYDEALHREKLLENEYLKQRHVVTGEGQKAIQYNILKREAESNRQLYDMMLQQMKQASLASTLRASNIRVVDPAKTPKRPYKPDVPLTSGLGMLCGLLLGSALVVLSEQADRSIREPGETSLYLNLPELGILPEENTGIRVRIRPAHPQSSGDAPEQALIAGPRLTELAVLQRRRSVVAEAVRATLVSILFSGPNGDHPRTMVVTSANPSEGKTTVVTNLALAVAEMNHKVLLIDADLRKPRLHEIFNFKNDWGLSDLLRAPLPPDGAGLAGFLSDGFIRETGLPGLSVLTAGSTAASAATTLLYSSRMPELLKLLRAQFETLFIDSPPVLQIPDARVLGRMADGMILVVRSGSTTRDTITACFRRLSEDGLPVIGTILNSWNPKKHASYGYGGYHYNGYYKRGYYGSDETGKR